MDFIKRTIDLAIQNVDEGGRPFACLITRGDEIIAEAANQVAQTHDPTAHAEIVAIRAASSRLGTEHFTGCEFYVLAHPCPMCLAAIYYCSPERVNFITTRDDYSQHYTDDRRWFTLANFYSEIAKPWPERSLPMFHVPHPEGLQVYAHWKERNMP